MADYTRDHRLGRRLLVDFDVDLDHTGDRAGNHANSRILSSVYPSSDAVPCPTQL